jgi:guanine deaminase
MSPPSPSQRAFLGNALHTPTRGGIELLPGVLIEVDNEGVIQAIHGRDTPQAAAGAARHRAAGSLMTFGENEYLLPGLVDLHVHAPQWPQLGLALDLPLEEWLQAYTFPLEARYGDIDYARQVYESLVDALLANGTTTAMYFGSIHLAATQALADICLRRSQRALIGRVAMDDPAQCPAYYRDPDAGVAEAETRSFIGYVRSMAGNERGLVLPVITPRFIPSCTDELLRGLGRLARETGCHVQTHCSESDWAHEFVLTRYGVTDTAALERFGLLSRRTILAHGNFIDGPDVATILDTGAGIAHCPLSNVYFSDSVFPLRRMLDRGVHVGLGTDISGGSPSILENARHAVIASRSLESGVDPKLRRELRRSPDSRIDAATAFWLATAGGGIALDLRIGVFREGYQFDAIVLDGRTPDSNLHLGENAAPEDLLQKIVYHATRADIKEVWVASRRVHARLSASPVGAPRGG